MASDSAAAMPLAETPLLVLDTNIVLDLLVFEDCAMHKLREALESGAVCWLATAAMRDELARVLDYPHIVPHLCTPGKTNAHVLARFDALHQAVPPAMQATVRCSDSDDQMFINLAVTHQASLLSKDHAVLRLRKRLAALGARVGKVWPPA